MRRYRFGAIVAVAALLIAGSPTAGHAVQRCKARVKGKTGAVELRATDVGANPRWGVTADAVDRVFFDEATCFGGSTLRGCHLGAPGTLAERTPPPLCTICVGDDGPAPACCIEHIPSCVPGLRPGDGSFAADDPRLGGVELGGGSEPLRFNGQVQFLSPIGGGGAKVLGREAGAGVDTPQAVPPGETAHYCRSGGFPGELGSEFECITSPDCQVCVIGDDAKLGMSCTLNVECDSTGSSDGICAAGAICQEFAVFAMSGSDAFFTGFNVHIRDGSGSTGGLVNGRGNLIVGYDEDNGDDKSGSHNLVVGGFHTFSSYGGFVAGSDNAVTRANASVTGGARNTASGFWSVVSGGYHNTASIDYASVSGGDHNTASGTASSVSGGYGNTASGSVASVSGGRENTASGHYASVSGGGGNTASFRGTSVSGGKFNQASGPLAFYASVSGGRFNTASERYASVSGGGKNTASALLASVSGGYENTASGLGASVSGGRDNTASGSEASVSGGYENTASFRGASVSGGRSNTASGLGASVSGGFINDASDYYASVSGGKNNWANAPNASVSGGYSNIASGSRASVSGGANRSAPALDDWVAGGLFQDN